jgi:hypothetical protein
MRRIVMARPWRTVIGAAGVAVLVAMVLPVAVVGQAPPRPATATRSPAGARTADGHPDLQGTYDIATLTPLERPAIFGDKLTLTQAEADRLEQQVAQRIERAALPSEGNRNAPPVGGDGSSGAAGNVGGYNNFWIDSGTQYVVVNGQKRTSIIVDPPNGRIPGLASGARQRNAARTVQTTSDQQEGNDPGLEGAGAYDDPERRPLGERCLLGFGSTSGPPALPVLYNNLHQIVQTKDWVMILNEMNHDARIVRLNSEHLPASIRKWNGDSIGRWDGDTLVVETTNFTDKTRFRGSSENLKVTERFSRLDGKNLLYRFTVEDGSTWPQPWTGEYTWPATDDHLYEYACHEGNYALGNILRGARQREADATTSETRK